MNWDQIEGKWKQFKGSVKQQWGKITDDDLDFIAGTRDKFIGKLQERYGLAKEDAERAADKWLAAQADTKSADTARSQRKGQSRTGESASREKDRP
jgi:uncharacterized protein YjbJ (UPF0337 family)